MNSKTAFYTKLVKLVSEDDSYPQREIIDHVSDNIRKIPREILRNAKAFYIPDHMYLNWITDGEATEDKYGLYWDRNCILNQRVVIPVTDLKGNVAGLCGYDDGSSLSEGEELVKYRYLNKDVFNKERHWLMGKGMYKRAIEENYVMIVDGLFDQMILEHNGYNSVSLLGTHLSKYHMQYLRHIKNWIVVSDQDRAGNELYDKCRLYNKHGNTTQLRFRGAEDIDEKIIVDREAVDKIASAFKLMRSQGFTLSCNIDDKNIKSLTS